ncbi:MAG: hypothetical protein IT385_03520 [Deltaproteobacteria bacterium]|nr:hypothetical protein [Deltaproteobacteria bacterium]
MSRFESLRLSLGFVTLTCGLLAACGDDTTGKTADTATATDTSDVFVPTDTTTATTATDSATTATDSATTATDSATTATDSATTATDSATTATDTGPDDTGTTDTATTTDTVTTETTTTTDTVTTETTTATDTTTSETVAGCPNGTIDDGEQCDGAELGDATCESLGFAATGTLGCADDCKSYDFTGCTPLCGNGTVDEGEVCDGANVPALLDCATFGYDGGALGCTDDCLGVVTTACTTTATCGDNDAEGPEACDGSDLGTDDLGAALTCEDFGFAAGGALACRADCGTWDLSACGANIPGWTCNPSYFGDGDCDCGCGLVDIDCGAGGIAACEYCNDAGACTTEPGCGEISAANTGVCEGTVVDCGNGVAGPGELCDGDDLRGLGCGDVGFDGGELDCTAACDLDVTGCTELEVPVGWTCSDEYYGDGDCDCGCGVKDVDCAGTADVTECEYCDACQESFADECADVVDGADTTQCVISTVPAGWTCDDALYGDTLCDCGCGVQDSDCAGTSDVAECDLCEACGTGACADLVDLTDTTQCEIPEPPLDWTCPVGFYGDGGCDCGCGALDFDCAGTADVNECEFCTTCQDTFDELCDDVVDPLDTTLCIGAVEVPAGWTCSDGWYDDGDCDCGCGVKDSDCAGTADVSECEFCADCDGAGACSTRVDPADTTQCVGGVTVPDEWTCSETWYGDEGCDCGCGAPDIDCETSDPAECTFCIDCAGEGDCADRVSADDPSICLAPSGWDCDLLYYGDTFCDCGCGIQDADCLATDDVEECYACDACGGDPDAETCDARVDAADTTLCVAPGDWVCSVAFYGDLADCDCGCGAQDPDCTVNDDPLECDYCERCEGTGTCDELVVADNTSMCLSDIPAEWVCPDAFYNDGSCDCGCGAQDLDCASDSDVGECTFCEACDADPGTDDCADFVDPIDTTMCLP